MLRITFARTNQSTDPPTRWHIDLSLPCGCKCGVRAGTDLAERPQVTVIRLIVCLGPRSSRSAAGGQIVIRFEREMTENPAVDRMIRSGRFARRRAVALSYLRAARTNGILVIRRIVPIDSGRTEHLLVCPRLDDSPRFQHVEPVAPAHRREAVCDNNHGAVFAQ